MWHYRRQDINRITIIFGPNVNKSERYEGLFTFGGEMTFVGDTEYLVPVCRYRIGFAIHAVAFSLPMWLWANALGMATHVVIGHIINLFALYMILFGLWCLGPHRWVVANTKDPDQYQVKWYRFYVVYVWFQQLAVLFYIIMLIAYIYQLFLSVTDKDN